MEWKPALPSKKKYLFADRMVKGLGMIAKFSEFFDAFDASEWTLRNSFWAYPEKYPGTKVNINLKLRLPSSSIIIVSILSSTKLISNTFFSLSPLQDQS